MTDHREGQMERVRGGSQRPRWVVEGLFTEREFRNGVPVEVLFGIFNQSKSRLRKVPDSGSCGCK